MKNFIAAAVLAGLIFTLPAGAESKSAFWNFDAETVGSIAQGFNAEAGDWKVTEFKFAASGRKVLAQEAASPEEIFNLVLVEGTSFKDLDISVRVWASMGRKDQGGGVVWRAKDARNYYVARYNPLEENYCLYKVKDGKRTELGSAKIKPLAGWHIVRVMMQGDQIKCLFDGREYLSVQDATFADPGQIGLWTKGDAQSYFDDFTVSGE